MLRFYTGAYLITEAEERIFRPLWDAHRSGTLVADPPPDSPWRRRSTTTPTTATTSTRACARAEAAAPGALRGARRANLVDVVFAYADASAATLAAEGARDLCGRDRFIAEVLASRRAGAGQRQGAAAQPRPRPLARRRGDSALGVVTCACAFERVLGRCAMVR